MLKLCKFRQLDPDAAQELLTPAVSDFMLKHKAAYGDRHVRPKHHWLYDVIESAFRHGMLKDMWIIERLHLRVKGEAELVRNTVSFEKSALAMVLCSQLHELRQGHAHDGLRGLGAPFPGAPEARLSDSLVSCSQCFHVDDIVFHGEDAGVCIACVADAGMLMLLVELLERTAVLSPHSASWRQTVRREVWTARACELAIAWRMHRGSLVIVRI